MRNRRREIAGTSSSDDVAFVLSDAPSIYEHLPGVGRIFLGLLNPRFRRKIFLLPAFPLQTANAPVGHRRSGEFQATIFHSRLSVEQGRKKSVPLFSRLCVVVKGLIGRVGQLDRAGAPTRRCPEERPLVEGYTFPWRRGDAPHARTTREGQRSTWRLPRREKTETHADVAACARCIAS